MSHENTLETVQAIQSEKIPRCALCGSEDNLSPINKTRHICDKCLSALERKWNTPSKTGFESHMFNLELQLEPYLSVKYLLGVIGAWADFSPLHLEAVCQNPALLTPGDYQRIFKVLHNNKAFLNQKFIDWHDVNIRLEALASLCKLESRRVRRFYSFPRNSDIRPYELNQLCHYLKLQPWDLLKWRKSRKKTYAIGLNEERINLMSTLNQKIDTLGRIRIPDKILFVLNLEARSRVAITANVEKEYIILTPIEGDRSGRYVRSIDNVGRVVIPKAIRKLFEIKDGDSWFTIVVANSRQIFLYKR